jgi:hypothetical protein
MLAADGDSSAAPVQLIYVHQPVATDAIALAAMGARPAGQPRRFCCIRPLGKRPMSGTNRRRKFSCRRSRTSRTGPRSTPRAILPGMTPRRNPPRRHPEAEFP